MADGPRSASALRLEWQDIVWEDPDGGEVHLHGVLPTVTYPDRLRPRRNWHGLALMVSEDEIGLWEHEEQLERESPGINRDEALIQGGDFSRLIQGISSLEGISAGGFPDPEPRRLQRMAERRGSPLYFAEPSLLDEDWTEWHERRAVEITRPFALLSRLWSGRRFQTKLRTVIGLVEPPEHCAQEFAPAAAVAAAWWLAEEHTLSPELMQERDTRLAGRLRGALADLRRRQGAPWVLLAVCHQAQRGSLLYALEAIPDAEVPLCTQDASEGSEESE